MQVLSKGFLTPKYQFYTGNDQYKPNVAQDELYASQFNEIFKKHGLGDPSVSIAVLDTGFNSKPTLESFPQAEFCRNNSLDLFEGDADVSTEIPHGTQLMYLFGAGHNDGRGMDGLVPGCSLAMYKISDNDGGNVSTTTIINAINKAIDNKIKVINVSFGSTTNDPNLYVACQRAKANNLTIVAAVADNGDGQLYYPAAYSSSLDNVIAVGALGRNNYSRASFSSYGSYVDVYAEGEDIKTLNSTTNNFVSSNGTSYSTAFVTATAAHMLSQNPALTPAQIKNILKASAGATASDPNVRYLRAYNAVQFAKYAPYLAQDNLLISGFNNYQLFGSMNAVSSFTPFIDTCDTYERTNLMENILPANIDGNILAEASKYYGLNLGQVSNGPKWFSLDLKVNFNGNTFNLIDHRLINYTPPTQGGYMTGPLDAKATEEGLSIKNLINIAAFSPSDINNSLFKVKVYAERKDGSLEIIQAYQGLKITELGEINLDLVILKNEFMRFQEQAKRRDARFSTVATTSPWDKAKWYEKSLMVAMVPFSILGCKGGSDSAPSGPIVVDPLDPIDNPIVIYRFEITRESDQKTIKFERTANSL